MNDSPPPTDQKLSANDSPFVGDLSSEDKFPDVGVTQSGDQPQPQSSQVDDDYHSLDIGSLKLKRLIGSVIIGTLVIVGLPIVGGVCWLVGPNPWMVALATVSVLLAAILVGWWYPGAEYQNASWRLNDDGLEIRRGVWWRHRIIIPHARMQHSDIEQGPLQRMYSLATLVVNTAGTKHASVQLDGLQFEVAERLRAELTSGRRSETRS